MQNYRVANEVHVIDSEEFEYLLPAGAVKITPQQANVLNTPQIKTPSEIDLEKDRAVNAEFTPAIIATMELLIPLIDNTLNVADVIEQAKAKRKAEL